MLMISWQLLTAISVLGLSISVILQRVLLHKDKINPFAYAVTFQGIVGVLLVTYTLLTTHSLALPGIQSVWPAAIIAVIFYGIGHIVYAKTLQRVEASAFSVLFATQAVWIMLLGILLFNESLTLLQIIGTLLIFGAVVMLAKNLRALFTEQGTLLGLLTGLLFGIAITAWSYVGRHTDTMAWAAVSFVGTALVALLIRPSTYVQIRPLLRGKLLPKLTLLAIFYAIGSVAMLYAYREGTFTLVTPLRQTGIIVTTLLALLLLRKERMNIRRKLLAATVCFAGTLLILL